MIFHDQPQMVEAVKSYFRRTGWAADISNQADAEQMLQRDAENALTEGFAAIDRKVVIEKATTAIWEHMEKRYGEQAAEMAPQWAELVLVAAGIISELDSDENQDNTDDKAYGS